MREFCSPSRNAGVRSVHGGLLLALCKMLVKGFKVGAGVGVVGVRTLT